MPTDTAAVLAAIERLHTAAIPGDAWKPKIYWAALSALEALVKEREAATVRWCSMSTYRELEADSEARLAGFLAAVGK